jgi:hypothetical protein
VCLTGGSQRRLLMVLGHNLHKQKRAPGVDARLNGVFVQARFTVAG